MTDRKKEIIEQGEALKAMGITNIAGISNIAAEMRTILDEYGKEYGHPPDGNAIIWILSQHHNRNMRESIHSTCGNYNTNKRCTIHGDCVHDPEDGKCMEYIPS